MSCPTNQVDPVKSRPAHFCPDRGGQGRERSLAGTGIDVVDVSRGSHQRLAPRGGRPDEITTTPSGVSRGWLRPDDPSTSTWARGMPSGPPAVLDG